MKTIFNSLALTAAIPFFSAAARRTTPGPQSIKYARSFTTTATAGPHRSGSALGFPVPSTTTRVGVATAACSSPTPAAQKLTTLIPTNKTRTLTCVSSVPSPVSSVVKPLTSAEVPILPRIPHPNRWTEFLPRQHPQFAVAHSPITLGEVQPFRSRIESVHVARMIYRLWTGANLPAELAAHCSKPVHPLCKSCPPTPKIFSPISSSRLKPRPSCANRRYPGFMLHPDSSHPIREQEFHRCTILMELTRPLCARTVLFTFETRSAERRPRSVKILKA